MAQPTESRTGTRRIAAALILLAALATGGLFVAFGRPAPEPAPLRIAAIAARPSVAPSVPVTVPRQAVADAPYVVRHILPIDGPLKIGDYYWNETGAPTNGPVIVTVDLAAQVLSVFRGGYEIGTAAIIYGADVKPTPLGVFPITQKDATHVSNLYNAPMPYMLRLTNDGVSIHGSAMDPSYMTHGCVGVPTAFARKLFGVVKIGDKAIVTRGETLGLGKAITAA